MWKRSTPEDSRAWNVCPPLERWEAAYAELDRALRKHPALRDLDAGERPTIWAGRDAVSLHTREAKYEIEDPRWWGRVTNPRAARVLVTELLDGLRPAREARRAARAPLPGPPVRG